MRALTFTAPDGFPEVRSRDSLAGLIAEAFAAEGIEPAEGDIVVVAQKIVSKAEGRQRRLDQVTPSTRALELAAIAKKDPRIVELVLQESRCVLRCVPGVLIVEDRRGFVMANAGIDASNVTGTSGAETVLLLPADPDESARQLRRELCTRWATSVGVVVNDSWGRAWRLGTVGAALGVAGLPGLLDLRGTPDRHGRILIETEVGIADEIAAGASALMGQAGEGRPVVLVRGFPYPLREGAGQELVRPPEQDLFR